MKGLGVVDLDTDERDPIELAVYAVQSSQTGYARTADIVLTVRKGVTGEICFRARAWAFTVE